MTPTNPPPEFVVFEAPDEVRANDRLELYTADVLT